MPGRWKGICAYDNYAVCVVRIQNFLHNVYDEAFRADPPYLLGVPRYLVNKRRNISVLLPVFRLDTRV